MADTFDVRVYWDEIAMEDLLNSPDGLVGRFLEELSIEVAALARARAPVRGPGSVWSQRSSAQPPGFLQASIEPNVGYDDEGDLYGGAVAAANPAIFLETPARQMHQAYPFLSSALFDVIDAADL